MACRILENLTSRNPNTNRRGRSVRTITNLIRNNQIDVPEGLLLNSQGRLILDNRRNRQNRNFTNRRETNNVVEYTIDTDEAERFGGGYIRELIRRSGLTGFINVSVYPSNTNNIQEVYGDDYNITGNLNNFWKTANIGVYMIDSDDFVYDKKFNPDGNEGRVVISQLRQIQPREIRQRFRDSPEKHCILQPIKNYIDTLKNDTDRKKFTNHIDRYLDIYKDGVPEENLQEIVNKLKISIYIKDIKNQITQQYRSIHSKKAFEFINTRINHLMELPKEYIDITEDEFKNMMNNLEIGDYYQPNYFIVKDEKQYILQREETKQVKEWEKKHKLEYIEEKEDFFYFIQQANHFGGTRNFENNFYEIQDFNDYEEIDMISSYVGFTHLEEYKKHGITRKPQYFSKVPEDFNFEDYEGFFLVKDLNCKDAKINNYVKQLNIYNKQDVFSVPELSYLKSIGFTFKCIMGAYTRNRQYLDFEELQNIGKEKEELRKKGDKKYQYYVAEYKKIIGKYCSKRDANVIILKGNDEMANILSNTYGADRIFKNDYNNTIRIYTKKERILNRAHISGYVLSYSRIAILKQLFKLPENIPVSITLDGIVVKKNQNINLEKNFRIKQLKKDFTKRNQCDTYMSSYNEKVYNAYEYKDYFKHKYNYFYGAGGAGKTYELLKNKALIDPCYVAPSNKLIRDVSNTYKHKNVCSLARLLGQGEPHTGNKNILIIDECSMMTETQKEKLLSIYKDNVIFFVGDLCQLPPFEKGQVQATFDEFNKVEFKKNYRCKDAELLKILNKLRYYIENNYDKKYINKYFLETLEKNKGNTDSYTVNDYILCSKHDYIKEHTEKHKDKPNKWIITKTNKTYSTGDIVIQDEKPISGELRHAFTAHACQGITIKDKLFIDTRMMFDACMCYTMLSRVQYLNQIILI